MAQQGKLVPTHTRTGTECFRDTWCQPSVSRYENITLNWKGMSTRTHTHTHVYTNIVLGTWHTAWGPEGSSDLQLFWQDQSSHKKTVLGPVLFSSIVQLYRPSAACLIVYMKLANDFTSVLKVRLNEHQQWIFSGLWKVQFGWVCDLRKG